MTYSPTFYPPLFATGTILFAPYLHSQFIGLSNSLPYSHRLYSLVILVTRPEKSLFHVKKLYQYIPKALLRRLTSKLQIYKHM